MPFDVAFSLLPADRAAYVIALGTLSSHIPGSALPYGDAALTTVSLVAQYMMTKKLLENWILWIVVGLAVSSFVGLDLLSALRP